MKVCTRTESITPFLISFWQASVDLTPASDTWVDTARVEARLLKLKEIMLRRWKSHKAVWTTRSSNWIFPIQWDHGNIFDWKRNSNKNSNWINDSRWRWWKKNCMQKSSCSGSWWMLLS